MNVWVLIIILFSLSYLVDQWVQSREKPDSPIQQPNVTLSKERWEEVKRRHKEEQMAKIRFLDIVAVATLYKFERSKKPDEYVWKVTEIQEVTHKGEPIVYKIYKSHHRDGLWYRYTPVEKNVPVKLRVSYHWGREGEPTFAAPVIFYRHEESGVIQRWQPLGRGEYVNPLGVWTHVEHTRVERLR